MPTKLPRRYLSRPPSTTFPGTGDRPATISSSDPYIPSDYGSIGLTLFELLNAAYSGGKGVASRRAMASPGARRPMRNEGILSRYQSGLPGVLVHRDDVSYLSPLADRRLRPDPLNPLYLKQELTDAEVSQLRKEQREIEAAWSVRQAVYNKRRMKEYNDEKAEYLRDVVRTLDEVIEGTSDREVLVRLRARRLSAANELRRITGGIQ